MRAEAFVDKLLPVMVGEPAWEMDFGFGLSEDPRDPPVCRRASSPKHLRPKVFKGVLAGIPHDVFAAVVTSSYLPPDMTIEEWRKLAAQRTGQPHGRRSRGSRLCLALGPFDSEGEQVTNIGVVIANQKAPDEVDSIQALFRRSRAYRRMRRRHGLSGRNLARRCSSA